MARGDPWSDLGEEVTTQTPPQAQPAPAPVLRPVLTVPQDPLKVQQQQASIQSQQQQATLEPQRFRHQVEQDAQGQSQQQKDAQFWLRAMSANADYSKVASVGPRGLVDQTLADSHPDAVNAASSPERQQADQA